MAPAAAIALRMGIPALIKLAERVFTKKNKDDKLGAQRKDFVVNGMGGLLDRLAREGKVNPQEVAPVLSQLVEVVFAELDDRGEVNVHKAPEGRRVVIEGVLRDV